VNIEHLGLFGVFLAGATPWIEAIAVVPAGILLGLDPVWVVSFAVVGNILTIAGFAYGGDQIKRWIDNRRLSKGKSAASSKFLKAQRAFDKYGIYGMAALGPIFIGTQFAAAVSVAAGVKPLKTTALISAATVVWATAIAFGISSIPEIPKL
jgi:hypothetical protein